MDLGTRGLQCWRRRINNTGMHVATDDQIEPWLSQASGDPWRVIPGPNGMGQFVNLLAGFHHAPTGDLLGSRANVAFLDGHVAAHSRMKTFPLAWPHEK
jgi:prepilin-type processing-associated H-X9-DG protein